MRQLATALLPAALFLSACSGGGGSSAAIEGIEAPSTMSVITTGTGGAGSAATTGALVAPAVTGLPADSQFMTDAVNVYVWDESMESLDTVNMILCFMRMTAAHQMVNQGPYIAQIDEALCEAGADGEEGDGQSANQGAADLNFWTVRSVRSSNEEPHAVDIWVPNLEQDLDGLIQGHMELTARVSTANPFGQFTLNFGFVPTGGSITEPGFFGTLSTLDTSGGEAGFLFFEQRGDVTVVPPVGEDAYLSQVNVTMTAEQTAGTARILQQRRWNDGFGGDSGIQGGEFLIAFDEDNVLTTSGGEDTCYSRTEFRQNAWRYNLYDAATGERIELNSGFGFKTESGDYGWIGYWGVWLPDGVEVTDGMTLTEDVWGDEEPAQYTLKLAPGKLIRRAQETLALTQLGDTDFFLGLFDEESAQYVEYLVRFTAGAFHKVAMKDFESGDFEPLPSPVVLETESMGYLSMYSPTLGGSALYVDGDSFVTYWSEEFVNGADDLFVGADEIELFGYFDLLASAIGASEWSDGDVYLPPAELVDEPHRFVFSKSDLTLYHDTDGTGTNLVPVGLAEGETPEGGIFSWGAHSGPLVLDVSGFAEPGDIWNELVTYTYETGPNPWNQYAVAVGVGGEEIAFDAPIQFSYTHSLGNDLNGDAAFAGQTFQLEYYRAGDLGGIPHEEQDWNEDGDTDHWVPSFSIAEGTLLGPTGTEYVIKPLEIEQNLLETPGDCGALSTAGLGVLTLPDAGLWTAPTVGPKPTVTAPPAVIDGVVQGQ